MRGKPARIERGVISPRRGHGPLRESCVSALVAQREGKLTLREHPAEYRPAPEITADELVNVRERLKLSRAVFASYLRTNVRTLENWEQGRAKPNAQAALLIKMVEAFPDTVQRLALIR